MISSNNYDSIEQLIFESGLRISSVNIDTLRKLLLVSLNTGNNLQFPIANYKRLTNASEAQLNNSRLIANGVGVHWPEIDEDLSLKGFLKDELKRLTGVNNEKPDGSPNPYAMAA
jgi:hypothetical protein